MFSSIPHLWPGLYVICMWTRNVASHLKYTVLCSLCQDLWIYEPETPLLQYIVCCHWATTAAWCAIPLSHYSSMVCYTTEPLQPHGVLPLSQRISTNFWFARLQLQRFVLLSILYVVRCTAQGEQYLNVCVFAFFGCFLPPWVRSSQKYNRRWSPVDRRDSWVEMNQLLIILKKNLLNLIFI